MLNQTTHKNILLQILKEIYTDTSLGPLLGFKGGTAAYLFYGLDRFSVDLDLDLLDETKEDYVFEKIKNILNNFGEIKEKFKKRNTLFFILSYNLEAQNIKIEISRRNFGSQYELKNYLGISMLVMARADMFAHKLVALTDRPNLTNRDLYDLWFCLKNNWEINKEIAEKRTKMNFKDYLKKCLLVAEGVEERNILSGIGELLDEKQKKWIKENLKKDLIFLLKLKLEE